MIGKQIKGKNFRRLLDYLLSKPGAVVLGGTLYGSDTDTLMQQLQVSRCLNPKLQKSVYHVSLSLSPSDRTLSAADWCAIASEYLEKMGFGNSQYVIVAHHDREHPHIHVAASRVNQATRKAVPQAWDYPRSEKVLRGLEKAYGLQPTPCSWEKLSRSPTTGECRLQKRTGQTSARVQIQQAIDHVCGDAPVLEVMIDRLAQQGITAELHGSGIRYHSGDFHFSGTQLGKAYTLPGLQRHKGILLTMPDPQLAPAQPLEPDSLTITPDYLLEPAPVPSAPDNLLEPDPWPTVKARLMQHYHLPELWLDELHNTGWLTGDQMGNAVFVERSLQGGTVTAQWQLSPHGDWEQLGDRPGAFWLGDAQAKRVLIACDPVALLHHAVEDHSDNPETTLYLCWSERVPIQWLKPEHQIVLTFEDPELERQLQQRAIALQSPSTDDWEL